MVFVSRRLARLAVQFFTFLSIMGILFVIANHQTVRNYIPALTSITPLFFQPDLSIYLTDVAITSCLKLNANGPLCGMPDQSWTRVDKDLLLGNSWTGKLYLLYHTALKESVEHQIDQDQRDKDMPTKNNEKAPKVIVDLAVSNPEVDGKIKNNVNGIPKHVLKDFHNNKVYDDQEHAALVEANAGNMGDLHTDKGKTASHFMKQAELEKLAKEKEDQANKGVGDGSANDDKSKEANKLNELQVDTGRDQNEDKKLAENQKDSERNKEEDKKLAEFAKDTGRDQNEDKKLNPEEAIAKRETAKSRHDLEVAYSIPTAAEIKEKGWVKKTNGIWVKYGNAGSSRAITAIDVLFGPDCVDPRPNWQLLKSQGPLLDVKYAPGAEPYLTIRRGKKVDYSKYKRPLKMRKDGKFKVLQVADLHFLTGVGQCRDPVPIESKDGCEADPRTLKFLNRVLDIEKPDFVVLTGDQIFGETAKDSETAVFKALNPFIERSIPYAVTMGNHDDEGSLLRHEVFGLLSLLPFAHGEIGPDDVAGVGNYVVVVQGVSLKNAALLFYFLDTHKYLQNPKVHLGYDWLKELQLKWLESAYAHLKKSISSYTKLHLSMAFFHIPLPEYRNMDQPMIGQHPEGVTAPKHNTHARDVLHQIGVSAVSCGHDHANDFCLMDTKEEQDKMWMCYGGGSGEGGYGGYGGYVRRLRVFEFDTSAGNIMTWKRREDEPDKPFDEQMMVSGGKVEMISSVNE